MTDQHPLTDEACQKIIDSQYCSKYGPEMYGYYVEEFMRAAFDKGADWKLQWVLTWLRKPGQWYVSPSTLADLLEEAMCQQHLRLDYQAAYSQLARKFTILERTLDDSEKVGDFWNAPHDADRVIYEAMELIQAVEKAELTVQVIQEDNS